MSDLVERVARQISGAPFPSERSKTKARAAIAEVFDALMLPSDDVVDEGCEAWHKSGPALDAECAAIWKAMLTQARAEAGV